DDRAPSVPAGPVPARRRSAGPGQQRRGGLVTAPESDAELSARLSARLNGYQPMAWEKLAESDHMLLISEGQAFPNGQRFHEFSFATHGQVPVSPEQVAFLLRAAADQIEERFGEPGRADR